RGENGLRRHAGAALHGPDLSRAVLRGRGGEGGGPAAEALNFRLKDRNRGGGLSSCEALFGCGQKPRRSSALRQQADRESKLENPSNRPVRSIDENLVRLARAHDQARLLVIGDAVG